MGRKKENGGARNMDRIAKTVFAPVYPMIAEQILDRCGVTRGQCLDVGSGPGSLGIALAQASDLSVTLLDSSSEALDIAEKNVLGAGLSGRISLLQGDVHDIPLPAGSMDLVVSRGSRRSDTMGKKKENGGARNMDRIAKTVFAPVYPITAEQILDRCGISRGRCLDIGSGPGSLGIALAQASDLFFWDDLARAFSEIYRVISPGGKAYVGGGFGNAELSDSITAAMAKKNPDWKAFRDKNLGPDNQARIANVVADRGLPHQIISDDSGFWVMIEKDG
jgi:2-polyprenyl-3-methyl-5-hydroxy-6-metoxy-1,4-benzoquinol methylase